MTLYGWVGRLLRINLSTGEIRKEDTMKYAKKYIGGRGLAARIAWEEIPPNISPFDPKNRLMFMAGPLAGTLAPTSGGRIEVCGVAPQVYPYPKYSRSSMGGYWGAELKYAGYDGVIIEGKSTKKVYLWINDDKVEIRDARNLWGLDTYATDKTLKTEHGKDVKSVCIGPAGENLVRIAIIQHGSENAAGQGGFGAVMGSKALKAIAVRGTGGVKIADAKRLLDLCEYVRALAKTNRDLAPDELQKRKACTMSCSVKNCGDSLQLYKNIHGMHDQLYTGVVQCTSPVFLRIIKPWEHGFEVAQLANMYGINHWEFTLGFTGTGKWLNNCVEKGIITEKDLGMPIDLESGAFWESY